MAPRTTLVVVVTKIDKVPMDGWPRSRGGQRAGRAITRRPIVPVSAATGEQMDVSSMGWTNSSPACSTPTGAR